MASVLLLVLCIIATCTSVYCHLAGVEREPKWSPFDYAEKTLEKLVRMEHEMELMKEDQEKYKQTLLDIQNRPSYAFSALWVDNTDANPNDALRFTRVNLNDHDVYDRNTGAFKTPVDGTYTFTAYVCVYNGEHLYLQFLADDAIIGAFNTGDRYSIACTASTAMSQLLKGQIVKLIVVKRTSSGNIIYNDDKGFLNSFSGMLIK